MIILERKLKNILNMVYTSAQEKCKEITDSSNDKIEKQLTEYENQCLLKAYNDIQKQLGLAKSEADSKILKEKNAAWQAISQKRQEMVSEIFEMVSASLLSFKKTEKYCDYLVSSAKSAISESDSKDFIIYLDRSDLQYKEALLLAIPDAEIVQCEEEIFGGIRIFAKDKNRIIDNSIKEALIRAREEFISSGKLGKE